MALRIQTAWCPHTSLAAAHTMHCCISIHAHSESCRDQVSQLCACRNSFLKELKSLKECCRDLALRAYTHFSISTTAKLMVRFHVEEKVKVQPQVLGLGSLHE